MLQCSQLHSKVTLEVITFNCWHNLVLGKTLTYEVIILKNYCKVNKKNSLEIGQKIPCDH